MRVIASKPLSVLSIALMILLSIPVLAQTSAQQTEQIRKPARPLSAERSDILFRDERQTTERPKLVMDTMQLKDGDLVADIGSGPGYYSLPLAERVGPSGVVFAVDIQQGMLDQLVERMEEAGVANVYPLLGALDDPHLPPGKIDWILLVDAYHEFGDPQGMLARMRESLAPDGRVALVEYRGEDDWPDLPERVFRIPRDHRMTNEEVMSEWVPGGFELVKRHDFLPAQHLFIFKVSGEKMSSIEKWYESAKVRPFELGEVPYLSSLGEYVYFAGQPAAQDFQAFAERGVKTVINLRMDAEMASLDFDEGASVRDAGMKYVHVPMGGEPLTDEALEKIMAALDGAADEPVLLHCASSNRVGFVWSLYRSARHGLGLEEAIADGQRAGMTSQPLVDRARATLAEAATP